jgi:hypothetical protein
MKPEYKIEKWAVVTLSGRKYLVGQIQGHPNCTPGKQHITSPIVKHHSDTLVETKNSMYHLGEPDEWVKQFAKVMSYAKN